MGLHPIITVTSLDVIIGKITLKDTWIKDHLKKLKQIKKDLKKNTTGTPLRKRDRIDVKSKMSFLWSRAARTPNKDGCVWV